MREQTVGEDTACRSGGRHVLRGEYGVDLLKGYVEGAETPDHLGGRDLIRRVVPVAGSTAAGSSSPTR